VRIGGGRVIIGCVSDDRSENNPALAILRARSEELVGYLGQYVSKYPGVPPKLREAIKYSLMAGGKRLRPTLVLESFTACATSSSSSSSSSSLTSAFAAAGAIELIHTFSLVHDDLPAMDNDDLRRGRPTNHKVFGEAMAILAGDAMVAMAFDLIANQVEPALAPKLVAELATASGPSGMIGGQVLDIGAENRSVTLQQLQEIHRMKSGALLTASCRLGAIAAGADEAKLASMTEFGRQLGLAFQIIDDILDVVSTPEQLGKATHKDASRGKNTYPALLGLEPSRAAARRLLEAALNALGEFPASADNLRALARFVVERQA
jgi:geranylgeranyl diphosphate synthase type II